jgi:hypothetical protein
MRKANQLKIEKEKYNCDSDGDSNGDDDDNTDKHALLNLYRTAKTLCFRAFRQLHGGKQNYTDILAKRLEQLNELILVDDVVKRFELYNYVFQYLIKLFITYTF